MFLETIEPPTAPFVLRAYSLGVLDFDAALSFQRRAVYDVRGDRSAGVLLLCEHPPSITVGRQGSWAHIHASPDELRARGWAVRWVNRGGGCLLHLPGQLAVYPVLALDRLGLNVRQYLDRLHACVRLVLAEFHIAAEYRPDTAGVWVGDRLIAPVGVAVRDWVSYFGLALNVCPDPEWLRRVDCGGAMTSLDRERRAPTRMATVRQRLLEVFAAQFGAERLSLFHSHPALSGKAPTDAVASRPL